MSVKLENNGSNNRFSVSVLKQIGPEMLMNALQCYNSECTFLIHLLKLRQLNKVFKWTWHHDYSNLDD